MSDLEQHIEENPLIVALVSAVYRRAYAGRDLTQGFSDRLIAELRDAEENLAKARDAAEIALNFIPAQIAEAIEAERDAIISRAEYEAEQAVLLGTSGAFELGRMVAAIRSRGEVSNG
jgi:hypothetical protein